MPIARCILLDTQTRNALFLARLKAFTPGPAFNNKPFPIYATTLPRSEIGNSFPSKPVYFRVELRGPQPARLFGDEVACE
jgi:hypothetical protein